MAERNSEKNITLFQEEKPSLESYWRSVVLFGRNTASYKFSLAESLLDFAKQGKTTVSLDELANPFSGNICRHIKKEERQATNASSTFLEACSDFVKEKISHEQLINSTVNNGFRYVLDCFHKVNGEELPVRFYEKSGKQLILTDDSSNTCDVDHFFPHTLQHLMPEVNLNGVWNLVLACPNCNRGTNGKFAKVPEIKYLERLHKRNEFLISSHHPLRETIINQTGKTEQERAAFLRDIDRRAINLLIHRWNTEERQEPSF